MNRCTHCGHGESEHRRNGACLAIVQTSRLQEVSICPCNDYEPEP